MQKKKLFLTLILSVVLSGCSSLTGSKEAADKDMSAYEKIQKSLVSMENYKAEATIEYINNKGKNTYETLQYGKSSGEYRIEIVGPEKVAGNITLSDGKMICQYNPRIAGKISVTTTESRDRSEILLTTFIKNHLNSHEVSINVTNMDQNWCTVLESSIPGDHAYLNTEKLWVDNTTYKPLKLVIYDSDGSERVIVTYKEFEYNVQLDDALFDTSALYK